MKWITGLVLFALVHCTTVAQEIHAGFSYQYLVAGQWDEAIRTYNFSRTFVFEKQPLLESGLRGSLTVLFKSKKSMKHGLNLSYSSFRSVSGEAQIKNILQLHLIQLGYVLHFAPLREGRGLCSEMIVSAIGSGLFRNVKGGAVEFDEGNPKAYGIGGDVCIKTGYGFPVNERASLLPFIAIAYTPYLYSPGAEAVLNQTTGLSGRSWTGIFSAQAGISLHFLKKQKP